MRYKHVKAVFDRFNDGRMFYQVSLVDVPEVENGVYEFSVPTNIEEVGNAIFYAEMPGTELKRYIRIAIEKNEFVKVKGY